MIDITWVIVTMWFIAGLVIGAVITISFVMFLGDREIKKRKNRSTEWQKLKKKLDKEYMDEYGV